MYTESSVELKSDFYSRYGTASGVLYFERVGLPFALLKGEDSVLGFAASCGVRAYGRRCGDVIKVLDSESNVCDVRFGGSGTGAQILYKTDIPGFGRCDETVRYTVKKLKARMGLCAVPRPDSDPAALCDAYGSGGWCAYVRGAEARSVPLPLDGYNVIVMRLRRNGGRRPSEGSLRCYNEGEDRRAAAAAEALRRCRTEVLFDMMNESEYAIEKLIPVSREARAAAEAARDIGGIAAARICGSGLLCVTESARTDSAAHALRETFCREMGYYAGIVVVK